jgi:hypothetical protein
MCICGRFLLGHLELVPPYAQTMIAHLSYAVSKIRNVSVRFILQHWELVHVCAIEFGLPKAVGIGGLMLICDASQKTFKEKKGLAYQNFPQSNSNFESPSSCGNLRFKFGIAPRVSIFSGGLYFPAIQCNKRRYLACWASIWSMRFLSNFAYQNLMRERASAQAS